MAKKVPMKLLSWRILEFCLAIWSVCSHSTSGRFFFASQMVGSLLYVHVQRFTELIHSSQLLNHFIPDTTSTATSNREMSWFGRIAWLPSSLTLAWHDCSVILQHIYTSHTLQITRSSVLFHSHPSMGSKDMPNHVAMTWSLLFIPSFFKHAAPYLGPALPTSRQSLRRNYLSQQNSCVKAYPLSFINSSYMSAPLALMRNPTINIFIQSSRSACRWRVINPIKHYSFQVLPALLSL